MTRELNCPNCGTEFDWNCGDVDSYDTEFTGYSVENKCCATCQNCGTEYLFTEIYYFEGYSGIELCD